MYYQSPYMPQQPQNGLKWVVGPDGARAYQMPPSSTDILLDSNADVFYIKSTDANGYATVRTFDYAERVQPEPGDFATKEDLAALNEKLDALLRGLEDDEQPVRQPEQAEGKPAAKRGRAGKANGGRQP